MRFSTAWAKTAAQNVTLKVATVTLSVITISQLGIIASLSSKEPLLIERSCFSKVLETKKGPTTDDEIKSFLKESIPMRFDSDGILKEGYLALEENILREKELATMQQKQMLQRVLINEIKIEDKNISIFTDRLISIGKVKSVLQLNLKVVVQQVNRTINNPYGLILSSVSQIEEKEAK